MSWDKERIAQLQLPDLADEDPHPRLRLEGYGVHAGQGFTALFLGADRPRLLVHIHAGI